MSKEIAQRSMRRITAERQKSQYQKQQHYANEASYVKILRIVPPWMLNS